jgi:transposase
MVAVVTMGPGVTKSLTQGNDGNRPGTSRQELADTLFAGEFNEAANADFGWNPEGARKPRDASTASKLRLLQFAQELGNVSEACRIAGFSRDSFYRYKRLFEAGGAAALATSERRQMPRPTRISPEIERSVLELVRTHPTYGRHMVSKMLHKRGIEISPSSVRLVLLRHGLQMVAQRRKLGT